MNGKSRRSAVLLGVVLASLCVAWLVYTIGGTPASAPAVDAIPVSDANVATTVDSPPLDALANSLVATSDAARSAVDPRANETWIDGRVEFPGGVTPAGPVEVVRQSNAADWLTPARFPVAGDGTFRVAVPPDARSYVDLASRELRIESPVRVDRLAPNEPLVLRALLAGRVRGHVVLAPGTEHERARFTGATIAVVRVGRGVFDAVPRDLSTRADERLEFEAGGLDPSSLYEMRLIVDERVRARSDRMQVIGGKLADVVIHVTPAARIAGHVTDSFGAPVANARVLATEVLDGRARSFGSAATTPADGSFSIDAYEGSVLGLRARKPGYLPADVALEPLDGGEARSGLVVVLERGPVVAGVVQWPDGKPAPNAHVEVLARYVTERSGRTTQESYTIEVVSDRDGRFEVNVSHASAVIVRARASRASSAHVEHPHRWWSGPDARALNRSVDPGSAPVVLTLEHNVRAAGVVVDDLGVPLRAFTVRAAPIVGTDGSIDPGEIVESEVTGERGEFLLDDLSPGEWLHEVTAPGWRATSRVVTLTPKTAAMRFVIERAARVRGRVVDATAGNVAGCTVFASTTFSSPFTTVGEVARVHTAECDARGGFAFDELAPGAVRIWVRDQSGTDGASTTLHLSPGSTIDDFVLALR